MIYNIVSDFSKLDISLRKLTNNFNVFFYGTSLFAAKKVFDDDVNIKELLKPKKDYFVTEINEDNLKYESQNVIEWCRDNFIKLDLQRLEKEKQAELKALMLMLDEVDEKMAQ